MSRDRTVHRPPHGGDLFVDREAASSAFARGLAIHARMLRDEPRTQARRNVLVFHGVGGVGKTTLSHRLEAWVHKRLPLLDHWGPRPATRVHATVRVDLEGSSGNVDVQAAVLAFRHELHSIKRSWPAFDFAFAAYWATAHPGQPLPGHGTTAGSRLEQAIGDTLAAVAGELGPANFATAGASALGLHVVRLLVDEVRRSDVRRRALATTDDHYGELLGRLVTEPSHADPRPDLLVELAGLLDDEIARWPGGPGPLVVVFVDTTERLALSERRIGESLLNRLVFHMPHVFFVMTGRNRLEWHSVRQTSLHRVGPRVWPGLAAGNPEESAQVLVGNLSPDDTRHLLEKARQSLGLPMSDEVVEALVSSSCGLPKYLDLGVAVATTARDNATGPVTIDDITGSLDDLVRRVMEDIPADEQEALRAAAMFSYFDTGLLAATAGVSHGCAERAVGRPMVDERVDDRYPYRMHEEVRAAIRAASPSVPSGWAEADWRAAAARALDEAHRRYEMCTGAEDSVGAMLAVGLACSIVCEFDVPVGPPRGKAVSYTDWLSKAVLFAPSTAGLGPYVPARSATGLGQGFIDFILAKSPALPLAERRRLLRGIFDSAHPLAIPAGRHLAYNLRLQQQWEEALDLFDELISRHASDLHRHQKALTFVTARRFVDAFAAWEGVSEVRQQRGMASLQRIHGHAEPWLSNRPAHEEPLRRAGRRREYLEARGDTLLEGLLMGRVPEEGEVEALRAEAESVGHGMAVRVCIATSLIQHPFDVDVAELDRLEAMDMRANNGRLGFRPVLVRVIHAIASDDLAGAAELRRTIEERTVRRSRSWIPVECALDHLGLPLSAQPTQWLEPYEDVRRRWVEHFTSLVARAREAGGS